MANYKTNGKPAVVVNLNGYQSPFQVDEATWESEGSKFGNVIYNASGIPLLNPTQTRVLRISSISGPGPYVPGELVADMSASYPGNSLNPQAAVDRAAQAFGVPVNGVQYNTGNRLWLPVVPTGYGTGNGPDPQKNDIPPGDVAMGPRPWSVGNYLAGQVVTYGGANYTCIKSGFSTVPPPNEPAMWSNQYVATQPVVNNNNSSNLFDKLFDPRFFFLLSQQSAEERRDRRERQEREEARREREEARLAREEAEYRLQERRLELEYEQRRRGQPMGEYPDDGYAEQYPQQQGE